MLMRTFYTLILFIFSTLIVNAQWTDYLSYSSATKVVEAENKIYCVTTGGLFSFNKSDNSIEKLTSINGLSDVGVRTIAYGEESGILLIAYENSNVDLINVEEQTVSNISDIKRKQIAGDKRIYNALFVGQTAYLSCGFGIVALNLDKNEVMDTYYIGENGSSIVVNEMVFNGQHLYAATEEGIYHADINEPNLQDFSNWDHVDNIPNSEGPFNLIEIFNGNIIVNYDGPGDDGDRIYMFDGNNWTDYLTIVKFAYDMQVTGDLLVIARKKQVDLFNENGDRIEKIDKFEFSDYLLTDLHIESATIDSEGNLWAADSEHGLIQRFGETAQLILPQGPIDNTIFSIFTANENLWIASGGRNAAWNNLNNDAQFQRFSDGGWTVFNKNSQPEMDQVDDIVCITVDPNNPNHFFAGSWGNGVLEYMDDQLVMRHDQSNSSLQSSIPDNPNYVRIGGMDFDSEGNLWITNSGVGEPLSVFRTNGEWGKAIDFEGVANSQFIGQIVITENDDKWIVLRKNDLYIVKGDGSEARLLRSTARFSNGVDEVFTPLNDIRSIAIDREGEIWLGTTKGVAVYQNPSDIWDQNPFYSAQPGLDLNDGIYHPLLETETVTAIAVDGANQKWFGTENSGIFLISEDGEKELEHFTESNSPLLSNTITSLAINQKTGEVFIGTDKGLISYMGLATEGNSSYADVYAYPNPVRENYEGDIIITGLKEDTNLKITDISGNLVYETDSQGGQASWNGKNLYGNRVSTGVYLVMGNDRLGEETFVTKILFIH